MFSCWFVDFSCTFFCCFCYRIVFRIGFPFVLFSLWGRVLPCAMHLTYTCFLWCTSDLGEEQVHQEPEDSQQECLADGAEEDAKVSYWSSVFFCTTFHFYLISVFCISLVFFCLDLYKGIFDPYFMSGMIYHWWYVYFYSGLSLYSCYVWSGTCDFVLYLFPDA